MLQVRVKEVARWFSITALGGMQFTKSSISFVPEEYEAQVKSNPYLEIVDAQEPDAPPVVAPDDEDVGLEAMNVKELKALAKDLKIKDVRKMKKDDLVAAIEASSIVEESGEDDKSEDIPADGSEDDVPEGDKSEDE